MEPGVTGGGVLVGAEGIASLRGLRCLCSWSGGKDSCLALHRAQQAGARVEWLVSMLIEGGERSRSHGLRADLIRAQAQSLGLRLTTVAASWANYEARFIGALSELATEGIEAGIFGDIDGQEHLEWEHKVCAAAGLTAALPLWQGERLSLVEEFVAAGFSTRIVMVRDGVLPPDYLGRTLDLELAAELQGLGVDASGENGEFHTVVVDGPCFRRPLAIEPGERVLRDGCWFLDFAVPA
jgi:diphthine-ammonia ligase